MAVVSILVAVAITSVFLGHWTPILIVCLIISLAPQLIGLEDRRQALTWLADLRQQCTVPWWRWVELLSARARFRKIVVLEFLIVEHQQRFMPSIADNFRWIDPTAEPDGDLNNDLCRRDCRLVEGSAVPDVSSAKLFTLDLCEAEASYKRHEAYTSPPNTRFIAPAYQFPFHLIPDRRLLYTKITVHDLVIIIRRLGLTWTVFKPEEGIVSATGNNRILYSTFEPSLGTLLHYETTGDIAPHPHSPYPPFTLRAADITIPTPQAAKPSFGILPGYKALNLPDYHISSIEDVYATLNLLDPTCKASQKVRDVRGICSESAFGFSDLIPMAAPMLRLRGSSIVRIPIPTQYCVGLTCNTPGFLIFHHRLAAYIAENQDLLTEHVPWVHAQISSLTTEFPEWENEILANQHANDRSLDFLERVHDCWDHTTKYFSSLQSDYDRAHLYLDLMATHIKHAVNYWNDAWSNIHERRAREHYGERDWIAEGAHCYWDYLPNIAKELQRKCGLEEKLVTEAWIMMMFRAMCWWRCHWMMEGDNMVDDLSRVPARYWESKLPIYIK